MSLRAMSDLLEDNGREGIVSSGVELVRESPSYMHSLREVWHEVHGRPASHRCPHNPRLVSSVKWVGGWSDLLFRPMGKKFRQYRGSSDREGFVKVTNLHGRHASPVASAFPGRFLRV